MRRKGLAGKASRLAGHLGGELSFGKDVSIVDSMRLPVRRLSREHCTKICHKNFETAYDKGYCAVDGQYYIGFKLHRVTSLDSVYRQIDITNARVHDVGFFKDIKNGGRGVNAILLADMGYLSNPYQIDIFESVQVELKAPTRATKRISSLSRTYSKKTGNG